MDPDNRDMRGGSSTRIAAQRAAAPTGAELVVDTLIRLGARHVFNISGLGMMGLAAAFHRRREEIEYVSHLNETSLALLAQGYARQTRKPAFCIVYHSSGTALAMMSLTTAWADHAPLVLISTTTSRTSSGRDQYAGTPRSILEMGAQYTKWSYEVELAERLPEILARAHSIAAEPPFGPVHIAIPSDLYDSVVPEIPRPAQFERTRTFVEDCADVAGLEEIASRLTGARLPVLLVGSEVGQLHADQELIELAELLGAPVLLEEMASYLSIPTTHAQYVGSIRANASLLSEADFALVMGVEFTELGIVGEVPYFPRPIGLGMMSVDRLHLTKQLWPDIAVAGHPKPSLRELAAIVRSQGVPAATKHRGLQVCAARRAQRRQVAEAVFALDRNVSPVPPAQLINEIRKVCRQDWIIMQVGSTAGFHFDSVYDMDHPRNFHALSGKASAQGWGVPGAIGIQMAAPEQRVVALAGDGNLMFSAPSIWAAAKNRLPIVFVIANNSGWASVSGGVRAFGDITAEQVDNMGWGFGDAPIDIVGFARSLGLEAARAQTAAELGAHLETAAASRRPWLIDVVTAVG